MRTILWFISFGIYTLYTTIHLPKINRFIKAGKIKEKRLYANRIAKKWAKFLISLTGSKVEVVGLENIPTDRNILFVSNHQGNFDIPLLLAYLPNPIGFVAKIELKKIPIVSTWMKLMDCVFMDRKDMRQSLRTISEATEMIKSGHSMVIFPEGTRSKNHEISPFKPGSLRMATKADALIVPITISGSYKIFEGNGNRIKPASVRIIVSPPVEPKDIDKSSDLTVTVFNIIKDHLDQSPS
ncbi:lysophospholipid acyltransferase family protein [Alkaliphilus transvaalensis]|uniref:lysophospholipid acyltransferase family protein n=1 Tax=Alkaliphilus transvaalensis TaxID=114628 RepID=UPI00047A7685|nr:lysophospholipid acyltransferase family protein [Alkaliphilus transvaalensis]